MKLKISEDLSLPIDAVTQTFAILGIRGSGKTNTGVVMMEEMVKAGQQCIAIDPTDAWSGIRSSRDGKAPGLNVYIFGGEHGDLPLEGGHGIEMANFVIESAASVVFSLRHLSMSEQRRFAADFGERLRFLKAKSENRNPVHLFLDEAEEFVPQNIDRDKSGFTARMFGAFNRMVRRDRNIGLGITLISQRPQSVNKEPLSQIETLICHRLLHKLDRESVKKSWVEGHDVQDRANQFLDSLASLEKGEAWVWSPYWLDIFKKIHIRYRETFDSSTTPKAGEKPKTASVRAPVDLDQLRGRLAASVEKAKAEDPRELKRKIADLQRELAKKPVITPAGPIPHNVLMKASREQVRSAILSRDAEWQAAVEPYLSKARDIAHASRVALEEIIRLPKPKPPAFTIAGMEVAINTKMPVNQVDIRDSYGRRQASITNVRSPVQLSDSNGRSLKPGALRMLAACAQWHPNGISEGQVAAMAKVKKSGGSFGTYKSNLVVGGYIRVQNDLWYATEEGLSHTGLERVGPAPSSTEDMLNLWNPKLKPGAQRMLQVLLTFHGNAITDEQLAELSGISDSGGSFGTYKSNLVTAGLAVKPGRGMIAANKESLFL